MTAAGSLYGKCLHVGVVTMPCGPNYGNLLQKYASQHLWEHAGFGAVTLDRHDLWGTWGRPASQEVRHAYRLFHHKVGTMLRGFGLLAPAPRSARETISAERLEAFDRFAGRIRVEPVGRDLPEGLADRFRLFSAGSDQNWNPRYIHDPAWNFLRFAPRSKRVALCPSIGVASVSRDDARLLRRGLAGFDELSVREEDGAALIRELTGREATVLVDPTLMLTAEEWRDVADGRLTPAEPYVFAYILGKEDPARDALIARLAAGRQVIRISDRDDGTELPAGPAEFIDLVDHAALVVTDSFHGSVFATLLATPLVEVPRAGGEHMAGRIDTLVSKLGLARVPVGEGDAPAVPEGVPGGEGACGAGSAGKKSADVAAPAAPAAAEMTQGGASPAAASRADWLVPTPTTPELLAAERRKFASYLAGVLDSRGYPEQAARARAAWGVSSDDARAAGAGTAAGAAAGTAAAAVAAPEDRDPHVPSGGE